MICLWVNCVITLLLLDFHIWRELMHWVYISLGTSFYFVAVKWCIWNDNILKCCPQTSYVRGGEKLISTLIPTPCRHWLWDSGDAAQQSVCSKSFRRFWCRLRFENYWTRRSEAVATGQSLWPFPKLRDGLSDKRPFCYSYPGLVGKIIIAWHKFDGLSNVWDLLAGSCQCQCVSTRGFLRALRHHPLMGFAGWKWDYLCQGLCLTCKGIWKEKNVLHLP